MFHVKKKKLSNSMDGMYAIRKLYCVKSGFSLWVMLGLYLLSIARAFFSAELNQLYWVINIYMLGCIFHRLFGC